MVADRMDVTASSTFKHSSNRVKLNDNGKRRNVFDHDRTQSFVLYSLLLLFGT